MKRFNWYLPEGYKPWINQKEAMRWAVERHQAGLWLDMGMGKTELSFNLAENHRRQGNLECTIIFSLLSSVETVWEKCIKRCCPEASVVNIVKSQSKESRLKALSLDAQYYIINYDALPTLREQLIEKFKDKKFAIIADESAQIKNPYALRTKAACALGQYASYRYCLDGEPIAQGPEDIFGQYLFLDNSVFGTSFMAFRAEWFQMGGFEGKQIIGLKPEKEQEFNKLVYSISIRQLKKDYKDLPPKTYQERSFELDAEEKKAYMTMAKEWVLNVKNGDIVAVNGVTKAMRLAQICTGYVGTEEEDGVLHDFSAKSKLKALGSLVEEIDGKFTVWCRWKKNVRDVCAYLAAQGVGAVDYYGETKNKKENEEAFMTDPKIRAFVGTGASGAMSLNLQGPEMKTVIYFSQDQKCRIRRQSEDRTWRGDISHQVTVFDLIAKGTCEASIVKALKDGRDLSDYLLQQPDLFVKGEL